MSTDPIPNPHDTDPMRSIEYEGRMMPYAAASRWVFLLEHAATTAAYVARPETWPGYIAWIEQNSPDLPAIAGSDLARKGAAADAQHLIDMAHVAREKLEEAAGNREH